MSPQEIYDSIAECKDESTRNVLYLQFCAKYFPKCYELLSIGKEAGEKVA